MWWGIGLVGAALGAVVLAVHARVTPERDDAGEVRWLREAMRGPEALAVRAEFRRRGIVPPERRALPVGFGL